MRVSNRRKLTTVLAAVAAVSIFASAAFAARLAGEDRWETAAEISKANWEPEFTQTVFLASGDVFADSLAGGPSTFFEGPVLLTHDPEQEGFPDGDLSDPTRQELERLRPCQVEAWGGEVRITDEMLLEAESWTAEPEDPKCVEDVPQRLQRIAEHRQAERQAK